MVARRGHEHHADGVSRRPPVALHAHDDRRGRVVRTSCRSSRRRARPSEQHVAQPRRRRRPTPGRVAAVVERRPAAPSPGRPRRSSSREEHEADGRPAEQDGRGRSSTGASMTGTRRQRRSVARILGGQGRRAADSLNRVIDPRVLRDDPDRVRAAQAKRGLSARGRGRALAADAPAATAIVEFEAKRGEQKTLGKLIAQAQGDEKQDLLTRTKALAAEVKAAEAAQTEAEDGLARRRCCRSPTWPPTRRRPAARTTSSCSRRSARPRDFAAEGFEPRDHIELGRLLGRDRHRAGRQGLGLAASTSSPASAPSSSSR